MIRSTLFGHILALAGAFLFCAQAANSDPISPYYLTAGDQETNWIVQFSSTVATWAQQHPDNEGEYAIAVSDLVRTLGNGSGVYRGLGSEYTLDGVYTGVNFPYPPVDASFYDGTTDGRYNYSIDFSNGGVYRFGTDWTNPELLFATAANYLGITYDASNNSLWIARFSGNILENVTLTGSLLSSFSVAQFRLTSLALDPADGTLWMGSQETLGTYVQYSKAGLQLDSVHYPELTGFNTLGGEFPLVPEPGSVALGSLAIVALAGIPRGRRRGA